MTGGGRGGEMGDEGEREVYGCRRRKNGKVLYYREMMIKFAPDLCIRVGERAEEELQ